MNTFAKLSKYAVMAFVAVSMISCSSDEGGENNNDDNPQSGPFVAKVDGENFATKGYQAKYLSSTKMLQIIGNTESNEETIVISIIRIGDETITSLSDWTPQTFEMGAPNPWGEGYYTSSIGYNKYNYNIDGYEMWQNNPEGEIQVGQIKITEISGNHIKGTFFVDTYKYDGTYNLSDVKHITVGAFDLDVTIQ
ncbi:MAG: hypothetical protein WCY89_03130 [Flavobacteriaceae bacterium]